jgi:serine/threonine-protein kinase
MMRYGIVWCPHCRGPHKLGEPVCEVTGKKLDQRIHKAGPQARFADRRARHKLVGTEIDGKYLLTRRIGVGGMGEVFEAQNLILGRKVAIKLVAGTNKDAADRLRREAQVIASMQHPNICDVYDIGSMPNGSPYLVLELLKGETLHLHLRRKGRLSKALAIEIFGQILSGAQRAHSNGIVHRDLKPANVFLVDRTDQTELPLVKLVDFGLAKDVTGRQSRGMTRPGKACGTPHYMAPEQLLSRPVDARTDIFSAGILLCEALTNRHPFAAPTVIETTMKIAYEDPDLSRLKRVSTPDMIAIVERALAKDPANRFQSAIEMATALSDIDLAEDEESVSAPHSVPWISLQDSSSSSYG